MHLESTDWKRRQCPMMYAVTVWWGSLTDAGRTRLCSAFMLSHEGDDCVGMTRAALPLARSHCDTPNISMTDEFLGADTEGRTWFCVEAGRRGNVHKGLSEILRVSLWSVAGLQKCVHPTVIES